MGVEKDYYRILGIQVDAGRQEIRHAYHQLVRRYHPDSNAETADQAYFIEIQEAYDVLGDDHRRQAYDRWRAAQGIDDTPALRLEVSLSQEVLPADSETQLLYSYAQILPGRRVRTEPSTLDLCLVLDRSTSMQGEKLAKLKEATLNLINLLDKRDLFSLITFSDRPTIVLDHYHGNDVAAMRLAIERIKADGGTEIYQGLRAGMELFQHPGQTERSMKQIILLTDGQTYGDEEQCLQLARDAKRRHINITAFGIGTDWNDELLDEIARRSDGICAFIEHPDQISDIFHKRIQSMQSVFARNARFTVHHVQDIKLRDAFQILPSVSRLQTRGDEITVGHLGTETPATFLFEWLIQPHPNGIHQLAQLTAQADIPSQNLHAEQITRSISVRFDNRLSEPATPPDLIVRALERICAFRLQEKSMEDLASGKHLDATRRLQNLATRLLSMGERNLANAALLEAARISKTGRLSSRGQKQLKYGTRRLAGTLGEKEP